MKILIFLIVCNLSLGGANLTFFIFFEHRWLSLISGVSPIMSGIFMLYSALRLARIEAISQYLKEEQR